MYTVYCQFSIIYKRNPLKKKFVKEMPKLFIFHWNPFEIY